MVLLEFVTGLVCKSSFRALDATLLLIGLKWKLIVKQAYSANQILLGFLQFLRRFGAAIFQAFARKTEMDRQIIVRLIMVFRFLRKTDCKKVNWAEQIAIERRKISHEFSEGVLKSYS